MDKTNEEPDLLWSISSLKNIDVTPTGYATMWWFIMLRHLSFP